MEMIRREKDAMGICDDFLALHLMETIRREKDAMAFAMISWRRTQVGG